MRDYGGVDSDQEGFPEVKVRWAWWLAIRPKTLTMSVIPVLLGAAIAAMDGGGVPLTVLLAILLASLLIQVGTNLYNDAGDALRGADTPDRLGPARAVAEGWLSASAVLWAARLTFLMAAGVGLYLVQVGGWPILLVGLFSILAGVAYTAGRLPIAYTQLGELFVFLFFGVIAVTGTVWLLRLEWSISALWAGSAIGLIAAAVLVVNNYRDIESDRPAGKITLAVRLGKRPIRVLYLLLLLLPFLLVMGLSQQIGKPLAAVMSPALLVALYLGYSIYRMEHGRALNRLLAQTAQFQLLFGGLLIAGMHL